MAKIVKSIPSAEYGTLRAPWYDEMLDGNTRQIEPSDWQPRFKSVRSAASSLRQAAERRGKRYTVAVRGVDIYVEPSNGKGPRVAVEVKQTKRAPAKKAAAPKAAATKAPAKKAAPRKAAAPKR